MLHLVWTICVIFFIIWIKLALRRKRRNSYVENLPKIPFKVLLPLLRPNITTTELFQIYEKATNSIDGDGLKTFCIFANLAIVCDDPVNLRTILKSKDCFSKTHHFRLLPAVADGISFSESKLHKFQITIFFFRFHVRMLSIFGTDHQWQMDRENINTVTTSNILKTFEPGLNRRFSDFAKSLERFVDHSEFELTEHILGCNLKTFLGEFVHFEDQNC